MLISVILLAFGVPAFLVIRGVIRSKKEHERKLREIQDHIAEKSTSAIEDRREAIRLKREGQKNKDGHDHVI